MIVLELILDLYVVMTHNTFYNKEFSFCLVRWDHKFVSFRQTDKCQVYAALLWKGLPSTNTNYPNLGGRQADVM